MNCNLNPKLQVISPQSNEKDTKKQVPRQADGLKQQIVFLSIPKKKKKTSKKNPQNSEQKKLNKNNQTTKGT